MTTFVKIAGGMVVQRQPYAEQGFTEAPDDVVCGMLFDGGEFNSPAPPPPPPLTKVFRSTFVSRCTDAELTTLTNHLATENIKFREMYAACDYFLTTDSLFAALYWTVAVLLGSEVEPNFTKADELLAPEA